MAKKVESCCWALLPSLPPSLRPFARLSAFEEFRPPPPPPPTHVNRGLRRRRRRRADPVWVSFLECQS